MFTQYFIIYIFCFITRFLSINDYILIQKFDDLHKRLQESRKANDMANTETDDKLQNERCAMYRKGTFKDATC